MPDLSEEIIAAWAADVCAARPHPVPDDFAPELVDHGTSVVCERHNGQFVNLGFNKTGSAEQDRRLAQALRQSVWYMLEEIRLGGPHLAEPEGHA